MEDTAGTTTTPALGHIAISGTKLGPVDLVKDQDTTQGWDLRLAPKTRTLSTPGLQPRIITSNPRL